MYNPVKLQCTGTFLKSKELKYGAITWSKSVRHGSFTSTVTWNYYTIPIRNLIICTEINSRVNLLLKFTESFTTTPSDL